MGEPRIYQFLVFDPPTPMGRKRARFVDGKGITHYPEKKDVRSLHETRKAFREAYPNEPLIAGAVRLSVRLFHKCPANVSRKKRVTYWMNPAVMITKPDVPNIMAQICDALTGYAYVDDRLVRFGLCDKFYALDQEGNDTPPRMAITVEEL